MEPRVAPSPPYFPPSAGFLPFAPPSSAVLQLLLSPVLLWRSFLSTGLSTALYAASLGYYHYMTFLGYSALPFLEHTEVQCGAAETEYV